MDASELRPALAALGLSADSKEASKLLRRYDQTSRTRLQKLRHLLGCKERDKPDDDDARPKKGKRYCWCLCRRKVAKVAVDPLAGRSQAALDLLAKMAESRPHSAACLHELEEKRLFDAATPRGATMLPPPVSARGTPRTHPAAASKGGAAHPLTPRSSRPGSKVQLSTLAAPRERVLCARSDRPALALTAARSPRARGAQSRVASRRRSRHDPRPRHRSCCRARHCLRRHRAAPAGRPRVG